ncbi:MAG: ribonuclease HII [Clostridia bacterium]|nr:ribonuclease HII [Clostridia bacterium]
MREGRFAFEAAFWARGAELVAGVDEVGRGSLAGPVVAAAVILPPSARLPGLDDSKRLTPLARARLVPQIRGAALAWAVGSASRAEIDELGIVAATFCAMRRALAGLRRAPEAVLVDGFAIPGLAVPQRAIVGGDGLSPSIAAASVLAKVHRDRVMAILDGLYPGWGFARHKGYGTADHLARLAELGPSPVHRLSFRPARGEAGRTARGQALPIGAAGPAGGDGAREGAEARRRGG